MDQCCVRGCEGSNTNPNAWFFKLPWNNVIMFRTWLDWLGLSESELSRDSKVCSKHFLSSDIDSRPNRKFPALKSTAVPQVSHSSFKSNSSPRPTKHPASILRKRPSIEPPPSNPVQKTNLPPPVIVPAPIIYTSTFVQGLPQIEPTFVAVPFDQSKLRKILPKSEANIPTEKYNVVTNIQPQPCLIMIPQFDNTIPLSASTPAESQNSNHPVLRIAVNKVNNQSELPQSKVERKDESKRIRPKEEVEIRNYKLNRSVVFSFDPVTEEITVTKRKIYGTKVRDRNGNDTGVQKKSTTKKNSVTQESVDTLKKLCTKAEEESRDLRKRLRNLNQTHEKERFQIRKLQDQIVTTGISSTSTDRIMKKNNKRKVGVEDDNKSSQAGKKLKKNLPKITEITIFPNGVPSDSIVKKISQPTNQLIQDKIKQTKKIKNTEFRGIQSLSSIALKAENWDVNLGLLKSQ